MKRFFEMFLCAAGFHKVRTRVNAGATEKVCMRSYCYYRTILQQRRDSNIKLEQSHKSPRMKRIIK